MKTLKALFPIKTYLIYASLHCFLSLEPFAQLLTNGSFELPPSPRVNDAINIPVGSTLLTGWTIGGLGNGVNLVNGIQASYDVPAIDGSCKLVFNSGNSTPGCNISQTIDTVIGEDYELTFNVARIGGVGKLGLDVYVTSQTGKSLGYLNAIPPSTNGFGATQRIVFTATSTNTLVQFFDASSDTISTDIALDNVKIVLFTEHLTIQVSQIGISWISLKGVSYIVQYSTDANQPSWQGLNAPILGDGTTITVYDNVYINQPSRYYRVIRNQ